MRTRFRRGAYRSGWAFLACCALSLLAVDAGAHMLRPPRSGDVTYHDVSTFNVQVSPAPGLSSYKEFVRIQVRADFACPAGYWVRQAWMQTPHDMRVKNLPTTKGNVVGNVLLPPALLVSHSDLVWTMWGNMKKTGIAQVPIKLSAVCVKPNATSHTNAVKVVSETKTFPIRLRDNSTSTPSYMLFPAKATPRRFRHDCSQYSGSDTFVRGTSGSVTITSSIRPLQCGRTFDPKNPKISLALPYQSMHQCPNSLTGKRMVFLGRARGTATVDRRNSVDSTLGEVQLCHPKTDGAKYHGPVRAVRRGALRANFLTNPPQIKEYHVPRFQLRLEKAPERNPAQICKREEFSFTTEHLVMAVRKGPGADCNKPRDAEMDLTQWDTLRDAAVRRTCFAEARRLKSNGKWTSMPASGAGRRFPAKGAFNVDFVARYCHQPRPWRERKWWEIFSYHEEIHYNCANYMDSSYWSDTLSIPFDVTCITR